MDRNCVLTITTTLLSLPLVISLCNDPNCAVCNIAGNNCEECLKSFTLSLTSYSCSPCPSNCLTCTGDGYCQSCSPGFWGIQCLYKCPFNCKEDGCDKISGYCLKCDLGWYGPQCQEECNRCENEQCELLKCSLGCKDGYFPVINEGPSNCIPCPLFCKKCSNASFCNLCYTGHYIYQYTAPAGIVATCVNCSSVVPRCVDCTYDRNNVFCKNCEAGYVVNQDHNECVTTVPCTQCQNGCDSQGLCFGGCQPGWTGSKCDYACSNACETCINQNACLSCKDGYYTQMCTVSCKTNCKSGNYPRCRFGDGYCSNGCNKGFWGYQCENNCYNNCLDIASASELCHRNGTCYYGCKSGYLGSDCSQVSLTSSNPFSSTTTLRASTDETQLVSSTVIRSSTDKNMTTSATTSPTQTKTDEKATEANLQTVSDFQGSLGAAVGGSIVGVFVLGVLSAVVVFYLRKRILQKQKAGTQSKNVYYNVSMSASHEESSHSGNDRHPDRKDTKLASASNQCEATLYEILSERNKENLYDHLEQSSVNEIRKEVAENGSSVEYYNI